jgi:hypothetical protein
LVLVALGNVRAPNHTEGLFKFCTCQSVYRSKFSKFVLDPFALSSLCHEHRFTLVACEKCFL